MKANLPQTKTSLSNFGGVSSYLSKLKLALYGHVGFWDEEWTLESARSKDHFSKILLNENGSKCIEMESII